MKVAVLNGLLKNEEEMKRILELVVREFDKYEIVFYNIDLAELNLESYEGNSSRKMDETFNKLLASDAVIIASSIHMGNISHLLQNFFNYLEMPRYKSALLNKNVLPVLIHNKEDEMAAYCMLMNVMKTFNMYEANKLFIKIPSSIDDSYLDKICKYIKDRTKEFASILNPTVVERKQISKEKINQILQNQDLTADENQITLEAYNTPETNIRELTKEYTEKIKVKEILNNDQKANDVKEITQKYKSKIEQILDESLSFDDEEVELASGEMVRVAEEPIELNFVPEVKEEPVKVEPVKEEPKREIPKKEDIKPSDNRVVEVQYERAPSTETLDSLIARVVARTRQKEEEERAKKEEEFKKQQAEEKARLAEIEEQRRLAEIAQKEVEEQRQRELEEEKKAQEEQKKRYNEEFLRIIAEREAKEQEAKVEVTSTPFIELEDKEESERFEPESIKVLREKINALRESRDEMAREVESLKADANHVQKSLDEDKVKISKFELGAFDEPHEVIEYKDITLEDILGTVEAEEKKKEGMSLKDLTKNLIYLFKAPEKENMKTLIQINVEGDEGFNMYINIVDNKCTAFDGVNMNNDLTIYVKDEKWRTILDGEITLQKAFMTGLIKVTGNFMLLSKLDNTLLAYNK